ncbi:RNA polymerase sigma factor [Klebsiella indica]|uniref:RNA polymerase sigma factor n=1 Tax=Klebsiella indica TaxID=2582917 RepID=A0A5R9L8W4_9ENTR|nr:RNA polymerase sigma factor [Klebsiella indica]TLV05004.1 RNA polymerase sigma factor [Klebsiella indica]
MEVSRNHSHPTKHISDIYAELHPLLLRIMAYRTGSHRVAQTLSQHLYNQFLKSANDIKSDTEIRNALIRLALHTSTDYLRIEKCRERLLIGTLHMFDNYDYASDNESESEADKAERNRMTSILEKLPEQYRIPLHLSRVEGLTHAEIAARLSVSMNDIEIYLTRAMLYCRENMK